MQTRKGNRDEDFMMTVQRLLDQMDDVVYVQQATHVDDSLWRNLVLTLTRKIHVMELEMTKHSEEIIVMKDEVQIGARKMQIMELEMMKQSEEITALKEEVQRIKLMPNNNTFSLHEGDILTRFNGRSVRTRADLWQALESVLPGQSVEVAYCKANGEGPFLTSIQVTPHASPL